MKTKDMSSEAERSCNRENMTTGNDNQLWLPGRYSPMGREIFVQELLSCFFKSVITLYVSSFFLLRFSVFYFLKLFYSCFCDGGFFLPVFICLSLRFSHIQMIWQWLIQDFPEGSGNSESGCANLFFTNNCMKMKEFGCPGGVPGAPLDPPRYGFWV